MLVGEERLGQLVELGVVEQSAVLERGDQLGRDRIPPPARAHQQRDERGRQLTAASNAGEQLDCLGMPGAPSPAGRGGQQSPVELLGVIDREQLRRLLVTQPEHPTQRKSGFGRRSRQLPRSRCVGHGVRRLCARDRVEVRLVEGTKR